MGSTGGAGVMPATYSRELFGRAAELAAVLAALEGPGPRLVTITGRGGVGKTRLAVEALRAMTDVPDAPRIAAFIPLAGVVDPGLVTAEVAASLGVEAVPNTDPADALAARLASLNTLLVLDNAEHVLPAGPQLVALLDRCPQLRLLVTSQARLRVGCEQVIDLAPLAVPAAGEGDLTALAAQPAVACYCAAARAATGTFELTRANAPDVAELCRRVEGLPLAIGIAAARAGTLGAGDVVRLLAAAGLDALRGNHRDAPARHTGLRDAIAWTYGLLDHPQQRLLCDLSVVSGAFSLPVAVAVAGAAQHELGDVADRLAALVELHLVGAADARGVIVYELPGSVRDFARSAADAAGATEAAARRHIAWWAGRAAESQAASDSGDDTSTLAALTIARADATAALETALRLGATREAVDIACLLAGHWHDTGCTQSHLDLLDRLITAARRADEPNPTLAIVLADAALFHMRARPTPQPRAARDLAARAEQLARVSGDDGTLLRALAGVARVMPHLGDLDAAAAACREGRLLAERLGRKVWQGRFDVWSATAAYQGGDVARAVTDGRRGLALATAAGDQRTVLLVIGLLGPLAGDHPELAAELPPTEQAVAIARATGQLACIPKFQALLAGEALVRGDRAEAARHCADALDGARRLPPQAAAPHSLAAAIVIAAVYGDPAAAVRWHAGAMPEIERAGPSISPAALAIVRGAADGARTTLGSAARAEAARGRGMALHELLAEAHAAVTRWTTPAPGLTARQRDVLRLVAAGLTNKEIATRLRVTPKTVMHHTTAIYRTIGVRHRSEATAWALRHDLAV